MPDCLTKPVALTISVKANAQPNSRSKILNGRLVMPAIGAKRTLFLSKRLPSFMAHGRMCDCPVCTRAQGKCPRINLHEGKDDFDPRFYHSIFGFNFKVMEFQAALGLVQLSKVKNILQKRKYNVQYLNKGLEPFKGLLQLPRYSDEISYLAYPVVIKKPDIITRRVLRHKLEESGIETRPLFGCVPLHQPAYGYLKERYKGQLPNAEYIGLNGFYIGCHQYLKNKDLDYIIDTFAKILKELECVPSI